MIPYHGYEAPTALPHTSYTGHHHHPAQETPEPVPKYTRSVSDLTLSLTKYEERLFVAFCGASFSFYSPSTTSSAGGCGNGAATVDYLNLVYSPAFA